MTSFSFFFFFNDPATTEIYTLSLHDALPIFPIRSLDLVLQGRAPHARGFSADSSLDRDLAIEAMRACDVGALAERDASALSGGEQRRVFLARALAQQAGIWLLDEPVSGLDPRHRLEFLEILMKTHRERGTTVLLVTHEIDLARSEEHTSELQSR